MIVSIVAIQNKKIFRKKGYFYNFNKYIIQNYFHRTMKCLRNLPDADILGVIVDC